MLACQTVIGQDSNFEPVICGKEGLRVGDVVKCKLHWNHSRSRGDSRRRRKQYHKWLNS